MPIPPGLRPRHAPALAVLALALALTLSACGGGSSSTDAGSGPTTPAGTASSAAPTPEVGPLEQLVRVTKYGVGFGVPKEWRSVEAEELSDPGTLEKAAHRMRTTPGRLSRSMTQTGLQTLSISPEAPYDRITTSGLPVAHLSDSQIEQRLKAAGADLGPIRRVTSPSGIDVARVTYDLPQGRSMVTGEFLFVDRGDTTLLINATSDAIGQLGQVGDEVWRTLQPL